MLNMGSGLASRRWLGAVGLGAVVAATGVVPTAEAAGKMPIGVSVADQKSLFYVAAVAGMKDEAAKQGYELRIASASNNSSQQIKQVQDLLVQNIGALIFTSQDSTAAAAGVKAANKADVPVIAVDQKPENGSGKLATYIATDSVAAARELCTWQFGQFGNKGNIAILRGVLGSTAETQRSQGCKEALAKTPGVKAVAEQTANWDETEAYKAAQNILTANPELNAFFGESDAMALGAAKAAKQAGRTGLVFVGIDGFPTMFPAIKSGLVQATMAQNPYKMGVMAVDNAIALMKGEGKDIPAEQYIPTVLLNKDTIDKYKPSDFYGPTADAMQ
ncbi:substrate-binding domain-containing protein [Lichenihabitans sp. Uapishka_5]|uniref:substrate-binding domain-containing protein n=1 Tax=Lichenihabitans sp. Uapishka_5 TaxID=3037302 RepID=UPI0029E7E55E|nr:substrate-binding domain-containing protein [Lichenihabitans sp. Uapishka_5]MDX7950292.1 substrate-binding domain-containing protein [Lichenihabitans sp. Uapishka_5]